MELLTRVDEELLVADDELSIAELLAPTDESVEDCCIGVLDGPGTLEVDMPRVPT